MILMSEDNIRINDNVEISSEEVVGLWNNYSICQVVLKHVFCQFAQLRTEQISLKSFIREMEFQIKTIEEKQWNQTGHTKDGTPLTPDVLRRYREYI
ncbi:hypothetical protein LCGC14_1701930 [marine sediment metagenome]|uniref:Uncharacterized protein n=1 Tax=marine sediment metagenome TaxID=412755 RepID=A0A0F9I5A9_9ZZZZ